MNDIAHKNIPIGSLITTYYSGYFVLSRITCREGSGDLYHFVKVANKSGSQSNSKIESTCDEHFCEIVDPEQIYIAETRAAQHKFDYLKQFTS